MFLTCKYVLPIMERQGRGAIVNISSVASIRYTGYPSASYNASKGAVNQLTQSIAVQYAAKGIRANCVLPGLMNTPFILESLKGAYGPGGVEEMVRKRDAMVPMGKMGDAWDIAHASLFLASDEAKYITGVPLVVDGGLTCKFFLRPPPVLAGVLGPSAPRPTSPHELAPVAAASTPTSRTSCGA